jgi:hypothetical protein
MEHHLDQEPFFVGKCYSIADIALYAYTHVAGEGGFELANYPAVQAWLERVRSQPGHVPITERVGWFAPGRGAFCKSSLAKLGRRTEDLGQDSAGGQQPDG